MPKKMAIIDYNKYKVEECEKGICVAAKVCPAKVMQQEEAYEKLMIIGMCRGCSKCVVAYPFKVIVVGNI